MFITIILELKRWPFNSVLRYVHHIDFKALHINNTSKTRNIQKNRCSSVLKTLKHYKLIRKKKKRKRKTLLSRPKWRAIFFSSGNFTFEHSKGKNIKENVFNHLWLFDFLRIFNRFNIVSIMGQPHEEETNRFIRYQSQLCFCNGTSEHFCHDVVNCAGNSRCSSIFG